jgi:hypothetical protein
MPSDLKPCSLGQNNRPVPSNHRSIRTTHWTVERRWQLFNPHGPAQGVVGVVLVESIPWRNLPGQPEGQGPGWAEGRHPAEYIR